MNTKKFDEILADNVIYHFRNSDETIKDIGNHFGISMKEVLDILKKAGIKVFEFEVMGKPTEIEKTIEIEKTRKSMKQKKFKLGDFITNKMKDEIEFGAVIDWQRDEQDNGDIQYRYKIKYKIKSKPKFFEGWWVEDVMNKHPTLNEDNICKSCPLGKENKWDYGIPECKNYCSLLPNSDDEDEDDTEDNGAVQGGYIAKKYTINSPQDYVKSQELALKVRRLILNKFVRLHKQSEIGNSVRKVKRQVYWLRKNKYDIFGEIDEEYSPNTGELYCERLSIHCAKKGENHVRYNPDNQETQNENETEYIIDGPKRRLEIIEMFRTKGQL